MPEPRECDAGEAALDERVRAGGRNAADHVVLLGHQQPPVRAAVAQSASASNGRTVCASSHGSLDALAGERSPPPRARRMHGDAVGDDRQVTALAQLDSRADLRSAVSCVVDVDVAAAAEPESRPDRGGRRSPQRRLVAVASQGQTTVMLAIERISPRSSVAWWEVP